MVDAHELEDQLQQLQLENARLRAYIHSLAPHINGSIPHSTEGAPTNGSSYADARRLWDAAEHGLTREQVGRYSRQIILPSFGVHAQSRLCNGSVLVIGAGGLGSPALLYLAAAGVGRIGIVDRDAVELSNIHRQVIHKEASVGCHKADSAASAVASLNSAVTVETFKDGFTPANALEIIRGYDVVIDASDNAPTRYLISDACAVVRKPLVSGAAIGTDGQLTVYCHGLEGPCYRCLFPQAPAPQSCARCVDAGVLGVVPGIIGTMQALEAIKLLAGIGEPLSRRLLIMDAMSGRFHTVKLRVRSPKCVACGDAPQITEQTLAAYDYGAFTGQAANDAAPRPLQLLEASQRIRPQELQSRLAGDSSENGFGSQAVVVDVRPPEQYAIGSLPGSISAPWRSFDAHVDAIKQRLPHTSGAREPVENSNKEAMVYVVCRRGNDSQRAVARLRELGLQHAVDVVGGMEAWARAVDPTFPLY